MSNRKIPYAARVWCFAASTATVAVLLAATAACRRPDEPRARLEFTLALLKSDVSEVGAWLDAGFNVNEAPTTAESNGACATWLGKAADISNEKVLRLLVDAGAVVDAPADSKHGNTPLTCAAGGMGKSRAASMSLLLEHGADPSTRRADGMTPLMLAAREGDLVATRVMLDSGIEVDATAPDGSTALIYAATADSTRAEMVITLLLERGASLEHRAKAGQTAIDYAAEDGNAVAFARLKAAGARARRGLAPKAKESRPSYSASESQVDCFALSRMIKAKNPDMNFIEVAEVLDRAKRAGRCSWTQPD